MRLDRPTDSVRRLVRYLGRASFRVKTLVPILLVILGSGTLLSWMVRQEVEESLSKQFANRMDATLSEIASRATQGILVEDFLELQSMIRRVVSPPEIIYAYIEDADRDILLHTFEDGMPSKLAEQSRLPVAQDRGVTRLRSEDGLFQDYAASLFGGRLGAVHIGVTDRRIRQELNRVGRQIFLITVSSALVSICIISFVAHVLTQPIRELIQSIKRVGKGDFSIRTEIDTGDEIGELADQFNAMTGRLAQWQGKIEEAQQLLLRSERLATIGKIASGVAHEIGNPLHAAQQLCNALTDQPERMNDYLPLIREGLLRIHRVIYQFGSYSRGRKIQPRHMDVEEVIRDSIRLLGPQARQRNIDVHFAPDSTVRRIFGDPDSLVQVFTNVIINGIEAIDGRGTVCVRTFWTPATDRLPGRVGISIEDDGPGIPPEALEKIFDPFFSTKEPGHGTGLGLSICQDIVTLHGGSIEAKSEEGRGAIFVIRFPELPGDAIQEVDPCIEF